MPRNRSKAINSLFQVVTPQEESATPDDPLKKVRLFLAYIRVFLILTLLRSLSTIVDARINVYVCWIITRVHVHDPLKWIRICVALFWRNFERNLLLFGYFRILTSLYTLTKHFFDRRYVNLYLSTKYVYGHCTRALFSYTIEIFFLRNIFIQRQPT